MGDMQYGISSKTLAELATELGRNYDTVFRAAKRVNSGIASAGMLVSPQLELDIISAMRSDKKSVRKSVRKKSHLAAGTAREEEPAPSPEIAAPLFNSAYLKAIVYGHALLILVDLAILYGLPGGIAGALSGLFLHSAVRLAERPELVRTSGFAMAVCLLVDGLAWFVHVPAFRDSVSAEVSDLVTQFLAGAVCTMSAAALWVIRDAKLD